MSDMFSNYEVTYDTPNNLTKVHSYVHCNMPNTEYDDYGRIIAYTWKYGETVNLRFQLTGRIVVRNTDIVYQVAGEHPTEHTIGFVDQRAFNIVDLLSWRCSAIITEDDHTLTYVWTPEEDYVEPFNGGRSIYISIAEYIKDKQIIFTLMNDRYETVYEETIKPEDTFFTIEISEDLSNKLLKGIYFYQIAVVNENDVVTKLIADVTANVINVR